MTRQTINVITALLDGLTMAGLFGRLNYPGAPRFAVDPRSPDEILASIPEFKRPPRDEEREERVEGEYRVKDALARKLGVKVVRNRRHGEHVAKTRH
jgi:hypothetical protein